MQLINGGAPVTAAKGCCYFCNHYSNPKQWVETGAFVDYEGEIVLCRNCAEAVAQIIGWLPPDTTGKLRDQNSQLRATNKTLKAKADAFDLFQTRIEEINANLD